jgi:hypothetical protein
MQVVSMPDLYGGKIAAALDRQHPRDLFDVHFLFENGGIDEDLFRAFLVYLVSHDRPAVELLDPNLQDLAAQYDEEFVGMTVEAVTLDTLRATRDRLIAEIQKRARDNAPKRFLTSFQLLEPDWRAIGFEDEIGELPAVRWKALNLQKLQDSNPAKFGAEAERLARFLG